MSDVPPEVVERLYGGPPRGFVAARDAAVAAAREAGDAPGAAAIGRLRKPTTGAWLVNLLALRRPDLLDPLAELGGALRAAQRDLRGPKLRELSARRRELVAALVEQARELAEGDDPGSAAGLPLREVESTLTAALADEEVADRVRSGCLVRTTDYAGQSAAAASRSATPATTRSGGAATSRSGGRPGSDDTSTPRPRPARRSAARDTASTAKKGTTTGGTAGAATARRTADRAVRGEAAAARREQAATARRERAEAARREVDAARTAEKQARVALERAAAAEEAAAGRLARLDDELAALRRARLAAEAELDRLRRARQAAHRARTAAGRRLVEARAARDAR